MNLFVIFGIGAILGLGVMAWDKWILKTSEQEASQEKPFYVDLAYSWGPLCALLFSILLLVNYVNFTLVLTLATLGSLVMVLINRFVLAPKREQAVKAYTESVEEVEQETVELLKKPSSGVEFVRSLFPVLLVVFILRSFLVEPFQIPSGSMKPTLGVGDFILVNKFAYGIRLPVINKTIIPLSKPKRGDVVVFHYPPNPSIDYIKRVIGVPGDQIIYTQGKQLLVNGQRITTTPQGEISELARIKVRSPYDNSIQEVTDVVTYELYKEQLGDVEHDIYKMPSRGAPPDMQWTVPEGYYFMMGDNRDDSKDSRYWISDYSEGRSAEEFNKLLRDDKMYMVPDVNIVGKAFMVWMHWPDPKLSNLPSFSNDRLIR